MHASWCTSTVWEGLGVERNWELTGTCVIYSPRHDPSLADYPLTLALERTPSLLGLDTVSVTSQFQMCCACADPDLNWFETLRTTKHFPDET